MFLARIEISSADKTAHPYLCESSIVLSLRLSEIAILAALTPALEIATKSASPMIPAPIMPISNRVSAVMAEDYRIAANALAFATSHCLFTTASTSKLSAH
jgi:hypothetical protein